MNFNTEVKQALDKLAASNWHTNHPNDMKLWYAFFYQCLANTDNHIIEGKLEDILIEKLNPGNDSDLMTTIRDRVSLAMNIQDYLRCSESVAV